MILHEENSIPIDFIDRHLKSEDAFQKTSVVVLGHKRDYTKYLGTIKSLMRTVSDNQCIFYYPSFKFFKPISVHNKIN